MGVGVFPLVELPGFRAQTFHCPATRQWIGASTIAGVAVQIGADVVGAQAVPPPLPLLSPPQSPPISSCPARPPAPLPSPPSPK